MASLTDGQAAFIRNRALEIAKTKLVKVNKSAIVREAIECLMICLELYGEDYLQELQSKPSYLEPLRDDLQQILARLDNIELLPTKQVETVSEAVDLEYDGMLE